MFAIKKIELQDFKKFKGQHAFTFPKAPGLYHVTGINKDNPRLGPNGVGKSTLLDAICWCFYGRTSRGLKAGDVVTWGRKHCRVSVDLNVGGVATTVTRTQSPNSLMLTQGEKGRPVDQDAVTKALRLNADGFLASVMRPQFGESFLMLTPAAKLNLFSDILELDVWLEKAKLASELADEIYQSVVDLSRQLEVCTKQIEIFAADITKIEPQEQAFEETRRGQIKSKRGEINEAQERISNIDAALKKLHVTRKNHDAALTEDDKAMDEYADKLATLNTTLGKLDSELQAANKNIRNARQALTELPAAGVTCPRCRQKLSPSHLKAETKHLNGEINTHHTSAFEISANIDVKTKRKQEIFRIIGGMKAGKLDIMDKRAAATAAISNFERDRAMLSQTITISQQQITGLKVTDNPHTEFLEGKRKAWSKFRKDKLRLIEQLKEAQEEHASVQPWIAGFKKIRLFIIEQTLKALEIEINNNLASLGMPDWTISLDVERENKSGGVTKGFSVFVHAPDHKDPVRFEAWCGGETQRLCLAGDIGLSNLIMERAGLEGRIEFYDEPSEHLSAEGLLDLAETLAARAEDQNKRIFLIDHHVIDFGGFSGVIRIIKDGKGAHFEP